MIILAAKQVSPSFPVIAWYALGCALFVGAVLLMSRDRRNTIVRSAERTARRAVRKRRKP